MTPVAFLRSVPADARVTFWLAPDGWRHRRFDWAAVHPRGRLLFQPGRSDVFEKYLDVMAHLRDRGWSITSFDWRGQGGSGRLSPDPRVGHADDFGVMIDDLAAFWRGWRAEASGPAVVLGHSMGGHFVLRALAAGLVAPDAAILSAPMIAVRSPVGAWAGYRLARFMAGRGDPRRSAWRWSTDPDALAARRRRLTLDNSLGQDERWWYAADPDLELGPPSWAWVVEAFRAGAALQRDRGLVRIAAPVLMLVAENDRLVDAGAASRVAARLPNCELVRFGAAESAHEVLREGAGTRARAFAAIDRFLDARVPRA